MARSTTPEPGKPVRGSTTGRPLMAALDLLGRRWTLRLLWELRDGPLGPRAILANCEGLSSSVLYRRIRDLERSGLAQRLPDGSYLLTDLGRELGEAISALQRWSVKWARSSPGPVSSSQRPPGGAQRSARTVDTGEQERNACGRSHW
ncbi:winged helix-turn-helix transcriptional regulator [Pseudonocardia acaciae]|uniref:winged helix-turn-helix transcriptional regulator n=1 Tax=Pseudonocardia acaciae TaxID=551276 RepID=UPI001FE1FE4A|nr:helix-turn-helix domain-containing protein [Pseudonocardia acaciae]